MGTSAIYRTRPRQVTAIQVTATNVGDVRAFCDGGAMFIPNTPDSRAFWAVYRSKKDQAQDSPFWRAAKPGDWIIRLEDGRLTTETDTLFQDLWEQENAA